eukprot:6194483-Pleurochrysis_carterae.AAC.1
MSAARAKAPSQNAPLNCEGQRRAAGASSENSLGGECAGRAMTGRTSENACVESLGSVCAERVLARSKRRERRKVSEEVEGRNGKMGTQANGRMRNGRMQSIRLSGGPTG